MLVDREFQTTASKPKYKDKDVPMSQICSADIQHKPFLLSFFSYFAAFVSFAFLSLFMLVALLHFILIIAPYGILSTFIPFPYNTSTHIPTIYVYSYSTLVPGLIPSQSSFPSTFSAFGLTHICTSYLTPIPKFSSLSNQVEPLFSHLRQRLHQVQTLLLTDVDY